MRVLALVNVRLFETLSCTFFNLMSRNIVDISVIVTIIAGYRRILHCGVCPIDMCRALQHHPECAHGSSFMAGQVNVDRYKTCME